MRLKGKSAIVTGAGSGFGAGIARKFAAEGARVMVADINEAAARDVAAGIGGLAFRANVASGAEVRAMVEAAGAALGISARTLQRRLQEEATTFAEVVDGVRRDLAAAYLQNAEYTAAEVAFMLGYAEASSFHRAFRRWTGTTPEAFRSGGDRSAGEPAG